MQAQSNVFPEYKVNPYYLSRDTQEKAFYQNTHIESWIKVLHYLIKLLRTGRKHKLFISNSGIVRKLKENYNCDMPLSTVKHAIRKLRLDGFLKPVEQTVYHVKDEDLQLKNGRILELNKTKVIKYLRVDSLEDDLYKNGTKKSRERRLIRKKMYTILDYVKMGRAAITKSYRAYTNYQKKKYFAPEETIGLDVESFKESQGAYLDIFDDWMVEVDVGVKQN